MRASFYVDQKQTTVNVTGSQESTVATIDDGRFSLNVPTGVTVPTGLLYQFAGGVTPDQSGVYKVELTPASVAALEQANPNYHLTAGTDTQFLLDATLTITFQDTDDGNQQVGQAITKTGVADSTLALELNIPAGYKLADGQLRPTTYTFGKALNQTLVIQLAHDKKKVDHSDPLPPNEKTPTGKPIDGAHQDDLNQTITRTINVTTPDGQTTTTKQVAKIFRDATVDEVTGAVTYGAWSTDETDWKEFVPAAIVGYTPSRTAVSAVVVQNGQQPVTIDISYTANDQSVAIRFVDDVQGGSQVGPTITKNGKTNQEIGLDLHIPANYQLAEGQELPTSYKFTASKNQTITIHLVHQQQTVDPTKPGTNPEPNDPDWFREHGLVKDVTRTINYQGLSADQLAQIPASQRTQTVEFTRTATFDLLTGQLVAGSESPWTALSGQDQFAGFTPHAFAGYTAHPGEIAAVDHVTANDPDSTVTVTYTKNPVNPARPDQPGQPGSPENGGQTNTNSATSVVVHDGGNADQAGSRRLPQTGNHDDGQAASLGLLGASLATMFGLAGLKKQKEEK